MGSFNNTMENEILDHVFGGSDYTRVATVYIALFTVTPSDTGGGTECTGGAYARKSVTNNTTNWPAASGGSKNNGTAITFVTATASWGTVVAFAIMNNATAAAESNFICWGAVATSKQIQNNDVAKFNASAITITLD